MECARKRAFWHEWPLPLGLLQKTFHMRQTTKSSHTAAPSWLRHTLRRSRVTQQLIGRTDRSWRQVPATVGATALEDRASAGCTKCAFIRADDGIVRVGGQIAVTALAVWAKLQHRVLSFLLAGYQVVVRRQIQIRHRELLFVNQGRHSSIRKAQIITYRVRNRVDLPGVLPCHYPRA